MTRRSRRAASRWVVLALLLATLVVLLGAQGLSTRTTGRSATPAPSNGGPLASEGSILAWNGDRLESREAPLGKRIALTFDDGPDPRWTPKIAAALRRLHAPATFFVVGSQVVRHPEIVQRSAPGRLRAGEPQLHACRRRGPAGLGAAASARPHRQHAGRDRRHPPASLQAALLVRARRRVAAAG